MYNKEYFHNYTMKEGPLSYARKRTIIFAIVVVAAGIISRVITVGNVLIDKYLGDALYAALLYLILRICQPNQAKRDHANWAMVAAFVIELFQLSGIPLAMQQSGNRLLAYASIVIGTHFSWLDIVAYAVGILFAFGIDFGWIKESPIIE